MKQKKTVFEEVGKVCIEKLELPTASIVKSTRKLFERDGKMTVLAEFDSSRSVQHVLQNARKLAGSKIYIEKDLNLERQHDKKVMLQLKKEIKAHSSAHRIAVVNDKLVIAKNWFRWNKDKKLVCGQQDAETILSNLYTNCFSKICLDYNLLFKKFVSKNQKN